MPKGKGTYGSKVGRPTTKNKNKPKKEKVLTEMSNPFKPRKTNLKKKK